MAVDWNDPENYDFPLQVLCKQQRRVQKFYLEYYLAGGHLYENFASWAWYWGLDWPFAPTDSVASWIEGHWDLNQVIVDPVPGPFYRTIPGGYPFCLNWADPVTGYTTTFLEDLIQWKLVPLGTTWFQVSSAMESQCFAIDPFGPPQDVASPAYNWRTGFVENLLDRSKFWWESEDQVNPLTAYKLLYGRIPPEPTGEAPGVLYSTRTVWLEPVGSKYKVWKVKCKPGGCCCCCC